MAWMNAVFSNGVKGWEGGMGNSFMGELFYQVVGS